MSGATAAQRLGKTREEGEQLLDNFFKGFPKVKEAIEQSKEFLEKNGYVEDFIGRRRRLPEINLPAYEVTLANQNSANNFNPFIGCDNRVTISPKISYWNKKIADAVKASQEFQIKKAIEANKEYVPNDEMSNKAFEKLEKEARQDGVILKANTGRRAQASRQCFNARIQGCLDYNTKIYTKTGIYPIGDLCNQNISVWDGGAWSTATVLPSGKKQKCVLTTALGDEIICSPDHKFLVMNTNGTTRFKKLSELCTQDRLLLTEDYGNIEQGYLLRNIFPKIHAETVANKLDYSFDDITNPYIRGQILGRIASDGSYCMRTDGGSAVYLFVAEHEKEVLDYLKANLPYKYTVKAVQKKNQKVFMLIIYSTTLVKECLQLDIKNKIDEYFFSNSDLLRGFISGFFDGDGTASNSQINLTFGKQRDFSLITSQIKLALNFFGIRSTVSVLASRYRVNIRRADSKCFADRIGFINSNKQNKAIEKATVLDNHTFASHKVVRIKSIEITNDMIDMYDVCNTERGYFIANGYITHNSAASLTKIAMIDIANDELMKQYGAKLVITVHDEVLVECPAVYADLVEKRLPEIMTAAAAKAGDKVPQACDPMQVTRWYADEIAAKVLDEYTKLQKTLGPDEALNHLCEEHPEFPREAILATVKTGCDLEF